MGVEDSKAKERENRLVDSIIREVISEFKSNRSKVAIEILKRGREKHPENKKLLSLSKQIKQKLIAKQIHKLENEAVMLMAKGATDDAQKALRKIIRLDPSRTDLKHSHRNLKSENNEEYDKALRKDSIIRFYYLGGIAAFAVIVILCLGMSWDNRKHIKKAKEYIGYKSYSSAVEEINECGWLMAKGKSDLKIQLRLIVDKLYDESKNLAEKEQYESAIKLLETASNASFNPTEFDDIIASYKQLNQKIIDRLAKEAEADEAMRSAGNAKKLCDAAFNKAKQVNAHVYSTELFEAAERMSSEAQKHLDAKDFARAERRWLNAGQEFNKASSAAIFFEQEMGLAIAARDKCISMRKNTFGANAEIEAADLCKEANDKFGMAVKYVEAREFDKASEAWQDSEGIYNEALLSARQSDSYKESLERIRKWNRLEIGMLIFRASTITGKPKYVSRASDNCIQYFQDLPVYTVDKNGKGIVIEPVSGFVSLKNIGLQVVLDRVKLKCDTAYKKENKRYNYELNLYKDQHHGRRVPSSIKSNHDDQMKAIDNNYKIQKNNLIRGIIPTKPVYVVSHWSAPEADGVRSLLGLDGLPEKVELESGPKWQSRNQWGKLKVNLPQHNAMLLLGDPITSESSSNETVTRYGSVVDFAVLTFVMRHDGVPRLHHWKEPFWPVVFENLKEK